MSTTRPSISASMPMDGAKTGLIDRILRNTSISKRIWALVVLCVAGTAAVGGLSMAIESGIESRQAEIDRASEMRTLNDELRIEALEMRRAEKDFLLRKDEKYIRRYAEAVQGALAAVSGLRELPESTRIDAELEALSKGIDAHAAQFAKVAELHRNLGLDENSGLQGSLRKAVHGIEDRLSKIENDALAVKMLMMRRHEKDFIMRGDAKYVDAIAEREGEFRKLLAASTISAPDQSEIAGLLGTYVRDFRSYAAAAATIAAETGILSAVFAKLEPSFEAVQDYASGQARQARAEGERDKARLSELMAVTAGGILLLGVLAGFWIARSVARPLKRFSTIVEELAAGNTTMEIDGKEFRDEVGGMARSLETFRENLHREAEERESENRAREAEKQRRKEEEQAAAARAEEERRAAELRAREERRRTMLALADSFEQSVMGVVSTVASATDQMRMSAEKVSSSSEQTTRQTALVSSAAEEASANVQTVATATEELHSSIEEISRQATHSNRIAQNAVAEAGNANEKVEGLAASAQKIGDVIGLITDIASQTNLLALNATIEAARAGEAGKGFAVVATEVKSLADQTAKATEEIGAQIAAIQGSTAEAVQAIQAIGSTISQVGEIATTMASAVLEQGAATREISENVQQAATGTQDVSDNIARVTATAEENLAVSRQMLEAANGLASQGETLSTEVRRFLESVRAA